MTGFRVNDWDRSDRKVAVAEFWEKCGPAIAAAVDKSFHEARVKNPTFADIRERALLCKGWVERMKFDLNWSFPRIRDALPGLLRSKLIGGIEPDFDALAKRGTWTAEESGATQPPEPIASRETALELAAEMPEDEDLSPPPTDALARETA